MENENNMSTNNTVQQNASPQFTPEADSKKKKPIFKNGGFGLR